MRGRCHAKLWFISIALARLLAVWRSGGLLGRLAVSWKLESRMSATTPGLREGLENLMFPRCVSFR